MRKIIILGIVIFGLLIGCEVKNPTFPNNEKPMVYVTYPLDEETITDSLIDLNFDVENEQNIDSLQVFLNGNKIAVLTTTPYRFQISKNDYELGTKAVYAKAYDSNGKVGISEIKTFYWLSDIESSDIKIEFLRPILWEEFPTSSVNVKLLLESEYSIDSIFVYVDGNLVHTFTDEPYETILQIANPGTHNIYAKAKDSQNITATTSLVNFSINLPDIEPPTGFISYPADWNDVSGNFPVRITATDNVEVSEIELFIDGESFGNTTSEPYEFQIDSTTLDNGNHTVFAKIIDSSELFSYTQMINIRVEN